LTIRPEVGSFRFRSLNGWIVKKGQGLPVFRLSRALGVGRGAKAFLNMQGGLTRGVVPNPERQEEQAEKLRKVVSRQREALRRKDRKIEEQTAMLEKQAAEIERRRERRQRESKLKAKLKQQRLETFHLRNELYAIEDLVEKVWDDPEVGSLPDFIIIGAQKSATTAFYSLLTKHPNVEPAAMKELHFFDRPDRFDDGVEWYRRCFPLPQYKNGRRSITGEKTPYYLFHPHVPKRMAEVVPFVRLIVLLRNPVDRAYSHYHHHISIIEKGRWSEETLNLRVSGRKEPRTFEEAIVQQNSTYLPRGIYVDQLLRWSEYFSKEQTLVLKSENFFEHTTETMRLVQDFLDLPYQQLDLPPRKTDHRYEPMDPATRRRLEAYFEPHNQRLYEYLGVDFGW
jgi:hypothetical protein